MSKKNILFAQMLMLSSLQTIVIASGWNLLLRIAVVASGVSILVTAALIIKEWVKDGRKSKKEN